MALFIPWLYIGSTKVNPGGIINAHISQVWALAVEVIQARQVSCLDQCVFLCGAPKPKKALDGMC